MGIIPQIIGIELVNTVVTWKNLYVLAFRVDLHHVDNLSVSPRCVVHNELRFHRSVGQLVGTVGNDLVVAV